jgi:hypothetical protein
MTYKTSCNKWIIGGRSSKGPEGIQRKKSLLYRPTEKVALTSDK